MSNGDKIRKLFTLRDKAVKDKDQELFLSTQIEEITNSASSGYLASDRLKSNVTTISYDDDKKALTAAVMVYEQYFTKVRKTHGSYLLYFLVNTIAGWKIYKIVW